MPSATDLRARTGRARAATSGSTPSPAPRAATAPTVARGRAAVGSPSYPSPPSGAELAPCRAARDRIASMEVRGAGAIAREAALGVGSSARLVSESAWFARLEEGARWVLSSRPTAVSLRNALNLVLEPGRHGGKAADVVAAAERFARDSKAALDRIAQEAQRLLRPGMRVATHCNSQGALSPLLSPDLPAGITVVATETRPWRQGLLTVRQLAAAGVPATLVVDSAVHGLIAGGEVDAVLVGADTVALDGTLVNKVGTYPIALSAREACIPFYCLAETFKVSPYAPRGADVPIEERDAREILDGEAAALPAGVAVRNPVFDRTPGRLVTRFVTEAGAAEPAGIAPLAARLFGERRGWI